MKVNKMNRKTYSREVTGKLSRSEEPSPRYTVTGKVREISSSGGKVTKKTKESWAYINEDLRAVNNFLNNISLGTTVTWREFFTQTDGEGIICRSSVEVVPDKPRARKIR